MAEDIFTPDRASLYHYKLDRVLGQGGTGKVYRGIDTKKGEVVAIKRFHDNFFRSRMHLNDLKASVKKFKKFNHENVVRIFDFLDGDERDGNCMIMEYVDGPNLNWYIKNRPFNAPERINICLQICAGLQYLHDNGVVHHDLKPANILFTRKGKVKIADFSLFGGGLLLQLFDRGLNEQITPMYVSPEILLKQKAGPASDIYSLGVTMYILFAERLPYAADSVQKLYMCHLRVVPEHPSQVNPKCSRPLGDIIMRCMEKRADARFQDCDQLRIALSQMGRSRI
jgi:serine/threonine-protein kinase